MELINQLKQVDALWHFGLAHIVFYLWYYAFVKWECGEWRKPYFFWDMAERRDHVQLTFLWTMATAFMWEVTEIFYNLAAYQDFRHFTLDAYVDLVVALAVVFVLTMNLWIIKRIEK